MAETRSPLRHTHTQCHVDCFFLGWDCAAILQSRCCFSRLKCATFWGFSQDLAEGDPSEPDYMEDYESTFLEQAAAVITSAH
eukprot:1688306-Amphidinium_carterae.1